MGEHADEMGVWFDVVFDVPDELFKEVFGDPRSQRRRLVTGGRNQGKTHAMRLNVKQTPPEPKPERPVRQMEVGILYYHNLTGSIILCTKACTPRKSLSIGDGWNPAEGICLVKGHMNRKIWAEYPLWSFIEPKNYDPYRGVLTLQNEFRPGEDGAP